MNINFQTPYDSKVLAGLQPNITQQLAGQNLFGNLRTLAGDMTDQASKLQGWQARQDLDSLYQDPNFDRNEQFRLMSKIDPMGSAQMRHSQDMAKAQQEQRLAQLEDQRKRQELGFLEKNVSQMSAQLGRLNSSKHAALKQMELLGADNPEYIKYKAEYDNYVNESEQVKKAYNAARSKYTDYARSLGYDPTDILLYLDKTAEGTGGGGQQVPSDTVKTPQQKLTEYAQQVKNLNNKYTENELRAHFGEQIDKFSDGKVQSSQRTDAINSAIKAFKGEGGKFRIPIASETEEQRIARTAKDKTFTAISKLSPTDRAALGNVLSKVKETDTVVDVFRNFKVAGVNIGRIFGGKDDDPTIQGIVNYLIQNKIRDTFTLDAALAEWEKKKPKSKTSRNLSTMDLD